MPLRALLRYLMQNEQLIQKLADSHVIRRAAQLTASLYHKGKEIGEDRLEKLRENETIQRVQNEAQHSTSKVKDSASRTVQRSSGVMQAFVNNLREEWSEGKKKMEEEKWREERKKLEEEEKNGRRRRRSRDKE